MTKVLKPPSVLEEKHMKKKKKTFLYKPFESKKQAWVAMVQNLIAKNTNKELTNALKKMSQAEEIPIKWNKINQPKFMNFMKYLMENQEDSVQNEKLWDLVSRDLKEKNANKTKEENSKIKNTKNENTLKEIEKDLAPVVVTKPVVVPVVKTNKTKEEKNKTKNTTNENKLKEVEKVLAPVIGTKPVVVPVVKTNKTKEEKNKTKNTTNENKLKEVEKVLAPVIGTKPVVVPVVKTTLTKPAVFPKSRNSLNYKTKEKAEWSTIIQNLIQTNTNEKLKTALEKISMAENIPVLKKLQYIQKSKFENFVKNIPGYEVNPVIDERLRIMITEALQEKRIQKNNEKYMAKKYPTIPIQNVKHSEWIILLKSLVGQTVDSICKELPSDAYQRIIQHGKIPKICYGIKNPEFKSFLKNNLECEVNPTIADQLMDLISKALEEQRTNKAKFPDKKNETNKIKATKRKNDIEDQKTAVNGTSKKRLKEKFQSKCRDGESCDAVNGTPAVCETSQQSIKVKWNTIGKTILRAQDANEMSLKKFQKKIVAEYLKQTGNVDGAESVEVLWCKCQKKLSKNSKFIIDAKKIKLVTNRLIDN